MAAAILAFSLFFLSLGAWAQSQQGTVTTDQAIVYRDADFDAPVLGNLKGGAVVTISKGKRGPFYKVRVKPGMMGWIADSDVSPGVLDLKEEAIKEREAAEDAQRKARPFFASRYRGPAFEYLSYSEDGTGSSRTDGMLFYGLKFSGFNTIFSGEIFTDANILFHSGAPKYYEDLTKRAADGFVVIANFLFQTVVPVSTWHFYYYGMGPTVKYSHFNLALPGSPGDTTYSADDLTVGATFNLGLAFRISPSFSLHTEVKYYWEKSQYWGGGAALGYIF
jgi:hypothetical protein